VLGTHRSGSRRILHAFACVQSTRSTDSAYEKPPTVVKFGAPKSSARKRDGSDIGKTGNLVVVSGDAAWVAQGHEF